MGVVRRFARPWVGVLGAALVLQVVLAPYSLLRMHGSAYEGGLGDTALTQWWFAWVAHAIRHGHDPFVSTLLFPPGGVNAVQNASSFLPAVLLAPVTALWGPSTSFNLLVFLASPLTAISAYAWLRRHAGPVGAAVGALPTAFSVTAMSSQNTHPFLTVLPLVPLVLIVLERIVAGEGRRRWNALWLGLLVPAQALTGAESLVILGLSVALMAVLLAVQRPRAVLPVVRRAWLPLVGGGVVTLVLLAYPLWILRSPRWKLTAPIQVRDTFEATPADLVQRPANLLFAPGHGYYQAAGGYLGPVVIALLVVALVVLRRDLATRTAVGVAAGITVLSWGGTLHTHPGQTGGAWLPWRVLESSSLLENALPVRFSIAVLFCLGFVLARLVTAVGSRGVRWQVGVGVLVAAALASIAPSQARPPRALDAPTPAFFTHGMPGIPTGARVLVGPSPTAVGTATMQWQADSDFRFALVDGSMSHPVDGVPRFLSPSLTSIALQPLAPGHVLSPAVVAAARKDLPSLDVCAIVIGQGDDMAREEQVVAEITGRAADRVTEGVAIWWIGCTG